MALPHELAEMEWRACWWIYASLLQRQLIEDKVRVEVARQFKPILPQRKLKAPKNKGKLVTKEELDTWLL